MTRQELLEQIADALQRDEALEENMLLSDIEEYDSLGIISPITLYDGFGIALTGSALRECESVKDLVILAKDVLQD